MNLLDICSEILSIILIKCDDYHRDIFLITCKSIKRLMDDKMWKKKVEYIVGYKLDSKPKGRSFCSMYTDIFNPGNMMKSGIIRECMEYTKAGYYSNNYMNKIYSMDWKTNMSLAINVACEKNNIQALDFLMNKLPIEGVNISISLMTLAGIYRAPEQDRDHILKLFCKKCPNHNHELEELARLTGKIALYDKIRKECDREV